MTQLTTKYRHYFTAEIRQQGEQLFKEQAIATYRADDYSLDGEIKDLHHLYLFKLWVFQKKIHWRCGCHEASHPKICPHLWAFFQLADKNKDFLQGGKRGVSLFQITEEKMEIETTSTLQFIPLTEEKTPIKMANDQDKKNTLLLVIQKLNSKLDHIPSLLFWSGKNKEQKWSSPKPIDFNLLSPQDFPDEFSSFIINLLRPCFPKSLPENPNLNYFLIKNTISTILFPLVAEHKRLFLKGQKKPLLYLGDQFTLHIDFQEIINGVHLFISLNNTHNKISLQEILWMNEQGLFITEKGVGRAEIYNSYSLISNYLGINNPCLISISSAEILVQRLIGRTQYPQTELPQNLIYPSQEITPIGHLFFRPAKFKFNGVEWLHAELSFEYAGLRISEDNPAKLLIDRQHRTTIPRQWNMEYQLREKLLELHFRYAEKAINEEIGWKLAPRHLEMVVKELLPQNWQIVADGKTYRMPTEKKMTLTCQSNDWFEINGGVQFGTEFIPLPQLLEMLKKQQNIIILGDGSFGVLPVEWLMNYTVLSEFTVTDDDLMKFKKSQIHLLNSLLDKLEIDFDQQAIEAKARLEQTFNYSALTEPPGFCGQLRPYQQIGLGWLVFLQKYGFGGCLADDMGLGKTIQILALLQKYYQENQNKNHRPSLLVLPRSLIFNWQLEAQKFTPDLTLHFHLGLGRMKRLKEVSQAHLILTTYGTLRRDAGALQHFQFAYCILDEAQAIKNSDCATSKAAQLVRADYRLAISGTPIENNLNDLLSLFQFLNPGLLHYSSLFKRLTQQQNEISAKESEEIHRFISPLILRRTKQQAAPELPSKTEDIIWCDMEPSQRHHYEQLKSYYHQALLPNDEQVTNTPKFEVLSALLRLRQAACHPGLIDSKYHQSPSGKINLLLEKLQELISEDHKMLIFSQFVQLLTIVKEHLDALQISYCYLDGQTENRQEVVNEFQNSSSKSIFLISLKAGGVGLNLTSADYVFLLDPWWNPAIENQAIDRAFRIGQKRQVFAYRLISRGTVEEKIVQLQSRKQKIASSLITETSTPEEIFTSESLKFILN